jgi:hypothetical protein
MMKRLFFTFFLIFTLFLPLSAQVRMGNFTQSGPVSQEMKDEGLVAAHPSLPLKTSVKLKNTTNNKEVNVTITNRVGVSSSRIIDLSAAAYKALDLKKGDIVSLSVNPPPATILPRVAVINESPPPVVEIIQVPAAQPAVVVAAQPAAPVQIAPTPVASGENTTVSTGQLPGINVVVTNSTPIYSGKETSQNDRIIVVNPNPPPSQNNSAYLAWMMAMTMEAREARASREEREIREAREEREAREARLAREEREEKEYREARDAREARYAREEREARETRLAREEREEREYREYREAIDVW